jgi:hypothetical protein
MEPFGFFSVDALRAGWYLIWRQFVRVLPVGAGSVLIGIFLMSHGLRPLGGFLIGIGLIVAAVWAAVLIPRLTSQWSESYYGFPLTGGSSLWWNVSWRTWVASFVAAIVLTPPQMVATSLKAAFPGSVLGGLGSLMSALLGLANIAVALLATGWAMSRIALAQSGNFFDTVPASMRDPLGPTVSEPTLEPPVITPVAAHPVAVAAPVAAPHTAVASAPAAVAPAPAVATVSHEGKRQCPKCSLYETEHGKVIGWYCRICGWRESRR